MKLLFVLEENETKPSGVVTLIKNKIENWKSSDFIYILLNKNHWAYEDFKKIKRKNYKVIKLEFAISDEINVYLKRKIQLDLVYKFIRLFLIPLEFLLNLRLLFYARNLIKSYKIECVFSHNGGWPGGILNRISLISSINLNINRILIIHNFPVKKNIFNYVFIKFNNLLIKLLNIKLITVSKSCKKDLILSLGFTKIKVIYNGISENIKKYKKIKRITTKIHLNYFGKIEYRKGLHLLIQALNNVKLNDIILNIYGDGDLNYKKNLKFLKKNKRFTLNFYKPISNITKVLENTDIIILPSIKFESFGMVLIEAMRQKIPIIASNSGGIKEVVKNNKNGLTFKNNNVDDLRKKIEILIKSKFLRVKLGNKGYKIFKNKFTNKRFIQEYENITNNE